MVFLQEVALDDNHNRIGDVLRVRRKEKRYIESVNPQLDLLDTHSLTSSKLFRIILKTPSEFKICIRHKERMLHLWTNISVEQNF